MVRIDVSGGKRYQQVYGIGTSLEASTDYNLHLLGPEARASLLSDLFDPDVGIGMTLGRVTIATSDFTSLPFYSYDDLADPNATDNNLTHFSVERARRNGGAPVYAGRFLRPPLAPCPLRVLTFET